MRIVSRRIQVKTGHMMLMDKEHKKKLLIEGMMMRMILNKSVKMNLQLKP